MGQQQSKDELLYQQVNYGNIEGIKSLCREGAGLEWIDKEGKTPLIAACMNPELLNVAKTLIELGANINAYRPGSHAGTPLHHAAKRGLDQTVNLLLSHGANALVMNDDCQTPLEVARVKGYGNVVRLIEHRICFFSGWLRELYLPGFLEVLAPQWLSKKNWVVVIPCGSRNPTKPLKLELALYSGHQEAQPHTVIALWKAKIEEPKLNQPDPVLVIFDNSSKTRYKFASANDGDKQQLQCFYNACRGIRQVLPPPLPPNAPLLPATAPPLTAEDVGNPNGWGNSLDNTGQNRRDQMGGPAAASSGSLDEPIKDAYNGWGISEAGPSSNPTQHIESQKIHTTHVIPEAASSVPSAPPIPEEIADDGRIHYPAIDSSPIDVSMPSMENGPARTSEVKEDGVANSSCVICLDAPVEGACIPCGHMAGCMSCLNEIEAKKWGCPVCRAKIDKVIRLYAV